MLDFYIIKDTEVRQTPNKLRYAGGLEFGPFKRLANLGIIDSKFDYYSDFRWQSSYLHQIALKMEGLESNTDIAKLKSIIDKAINTQSGLIAFAD